MSELFYHLVEGNKERGDEQDNTYAAQNQEYRPMLPQTVSRDLPLPNEPDPKPDYCSDCASKPEIHKPMSKTSNMDGRATCKNLGQNYGKANSPNCYKFTGEVGATKENVHIAFLHGDFRSRSIFSRTPKRMHPDQRGRAMDAGLGLNVEMGMKTGRLIGVACLDLLNRAAARRFRPAALKGLKRPVRLVPAMKKR
jgi:hypothetical protein